MSEGIGAHISADIAGDVSGDVAESVGATLPCISGTNGLSGRQEKREKSLLLVVRRTPGGTRLLCL